MYSHGLFQQLNGNFEHYIKLILNNSQIGSRKCFIHVLQVTNILVHYFFHFALELLNILFLP
jgi:hypothetical protein